MGRIEASLNNYPGIRRWHSFRATNVIQVDFQLRQRVRTESKVSEIQKPVKLDAIQAIEIEEQVLAPVIKPEAIQYLKPKNQAVVEAPSIDQVKKESANHPRKLVREVVEKWAKKIRFRRPSRCLSQPAHSPDKCRGRAHLRTDTPESSSTSQPNKFSRKDNIVGRESSRSKRSQESSKKRKLMLIA